MTQFSARNLLTGWDVVTLVLYLLMIAWIGLRFSTRQTSAESYFIGNRKVPGWAVGISMFASILSSFTFISFPGWTYEKDWQLLLKEYMSFFAVILCAATIIPIYRAVVQMSVYEYLERRFGYVARVYSSFGMLIGAPTGNGAVLYVMCLALNSVTGWNIHVLIVTIGLLTLVYTLYGGIEGVVWTEVIQGLLFMGAGVAALGYLIFFASPGGASAMLETATSADKFRLVDSRFSLVEPTIFIFVFTGLFQYLYAYSTSPALVQRYILADGVKDAVRGTFISVLCCMLTWALFMAIGTFLWAFYRLHPDRLAAGLKPDQVFPFFIGSELPHGMAGLVLAGLAASAMSGLASALNSASACLVSDFYDRLVPNAGVNRRLRASKAVVAILGVLGILFAFVPSFWEGGMMEFALNMSAIVGSLIGGGGLAIFMLGLFTRRAHWKGLYVGLVAGLFFASWAIATANGHLAFLPEYLKFKWHIWMLMACTNIFVFVVSYLASLVLAPGYRAADDLTIHGARARRHAAATSSDRNVNYVLLDDES